MVSFHLSRHSCFSHSILVLFLLFTHGVAVAQLPSDGYYRVKNTTTSRYILVTSDKGKVDYNATDVDLGSLKTLKNFNQVISSPGSVLFLQKTGTGRYSYTIMSQGTDTYAISGGNYLNITDNGNGTYKASGSDGQVTMYLVDEAGTASDGIVMTGKKNSTTSNWYVVPITTADDACFGITPDVTVGEQRFAAFYASFPFSFASSGMKAYYISKISQGMAVLSEWSGDVVPASMPVLISCSSASATSNKLNIGAKTSALGPTSNLLRGVYFDNTNKVLGNYVPYDPNTMRVLGRNANGELAFVKYTGSVVPANKAYLQVPAGSPDQLPVVTAEQYQAILDEPVTVTASDVTITYGAPFPSFTYTSTGGTLLGTPKLSCSATSISPAGTYPIVVSRGSVANTNLTTVDGTLTVKRAHLVLKVGDYTREQFEPNPDFELVSTGFTNRETIEDLTAAPVITCDATPDSPAGKYAINISGAESPNYDITYIPGTLTVTPSTAIHHQQESSGNQSATVYTLTGQRVKAPAKGFYIVNRRKYVSR